MRVGRAAQAAIPSFDAGDGRSIFLFDPFVLPKRIRNGRMPEKTGPPAQRPRRATAWGRRRAGCGQLAARRSVAIPLSRCASGSGLRAVNRSRYLSVPGPKGFAASFPTSGGKRVVRNDSSLRPGPCSLRGNESLGFSRLYCGASGGDPSALKGPGKFSSSRPNRFGDVAGSPPSVCGGSYFVPKDRARPAAGAVANPFRNPCGLRVRRTMRRLRAVHFNRPRRTANASGPGGTGFGVVRRSCVRGLSAQAQSRRRSSRR